MKVSELIKQLANEDFDDEVYLVHQNDDGEYIYSDCDGIVDSKRAFRDKYNLPCVTLIGI